jgi:hypothetical protein
VQRTIAAVRDGLDADLETAIALIRGNRSVETFLERHVAP